MNTIKTTNTSNYNNLSNEDKKEINETLDLLEQQDKVESIITNLSDQELTFYICWLSGADLSKRFSPKFRSKLRKRLLEIAGVDIADVHEPRRSA